MLLTEQEKKKFTEYLEQEIASAYAIVSQMEKLPRVPPQLIQENKLLAGACSIVKKRINSGESFSVGGKDGD